MKKPLIVLSCVALTVGAFAEEAKEVAGQDRAAQIKRHNERRYRFTGGDLVKPGKGYIAIVDRTAKMSDALKAASALLRDELHIDFRVVKDEPKDAGLVVRVIEESGKPPMLAAPEQSWAEVNVAALGDDLKDDAAKAKFVPARTRKMVIRAFAYAAGAAGSSFNGNLFDIVRVRDLDYVEEFIPIDAKGLILAHLKKLGLEPSKSSTYFQAVREGWAPAPTNDVQKAVWEKVHATPAKPIKISYDKDKQKPVVK